MRWIPEELLQSSKSESGEPVGRATDGQAAACSGAALWLGGADISTLEEVAAELNLTRERVRQIQIEALDQLRRVIKRGGVTRENLIVTPGNRIRRSPSITLASRISQHPLVPLFDAGAARVFCFRCQQPHE
jgi:hypothetical protein